MVDRTIPYKNIIMRCDNVNKISTPLPKGYEFKMFELGDEEAWAEIEYEIGDFVSKEDALKYFQKNYLPHLQLLKERCVFVIRGKEIVATCTAWFDYKDNKKIASLHWLATKPDHTNKGIGKAVCNKVLEIYANNNEMPIYLHTQPWSYKAINIYSNFGFYLVKTEILDDYKNEYQQAIIILKPLVDPLIYNKLIENAK